MAKGKSKGKTKGKSKDRLDFEDDDGTYFCNGATPEAAPYLFGRPDE